ncbi:hypothetical protein AMAG_08111 [Allomyces macrogynus ATCC 38327]|uniref:Protein YAE1 n=1 Tax=Allomyces macrogynus (strain ATCC 38327) TaxID=578462 RepID=A0A0L0SKA7_ALLM3|nr:hypothetical protein AMAG_08111 [Allomyces macrogynus ATCC 38327]|eukprot:KNE62937.1 hypothetical protein AMAG_08111 [Allomyces macrogynus ATCC 38327]
MDSDWASDVNDDDWQRQVSEREWQRLQDDHKKAGYREGVIEGKDQTMQAGFNDGFAAGSAIGLRVGQLVGRLRAQLLILSLTPTRTSETEADQLLDEGNALLSEASTVLRDLAHVYSTDRVRAMYDASMAPTASTESIVAASKLLDPASGSVAALRGKVEAWLHQFA